MNQSLSELLEIARQSFDAGKPVKVALESVKRHFEQVIVARPDPTGKQADIIEIKRPC